MPASPSLLALAVVAALVGDPSAPVSERAVELVEVPPPAPSAEVTITIEVASTPAGDDVEAAAVGVEGPEVAAAPEVPTPAEEIDERARIRRRIGAGVGAAAGSTLMFGATALLHARIYERIGDCLHQDLSAMDLGQALGKAITAGLTCAWIQTGNVLRGALSGLTISAQVVGAAGAGTLFGIASADRHALRRRFGWRGTGAIAGGGVLLGGGVVAFFAGSLYFRRSRALCEDAACYLDDTRGLLISVDAAALGMAVGAGLLGHGLAYRARIARNRRDHGLAGGRLQIAPLVSGGFVGLGVGGAL